MGFTLFGARYDIVSVLGTLAIAAGGGLLAQAIGAPLPWLSGALVVVAAMAMSGLTIGDRGPQFPIPLRMFFVPIIGVAIGGAFTPDLLHQALRWWPTLLALLLYIPLAHFVAYRIYRLGGVDTVTAYFGAMPGGLIEAIAMGEREGADAALLSLLQFSRLIFCILLTPLGFMAIEGAAVGSAAGVEIEGAAAPIGVFDLFVLVGCGALGVIGAQRIGMPAAIITGPILLSGAAHMLGLTKAIPPAWAIALTQLVVGATLGLRFVGIDRRAALRSLALAASAILISLAIAVGFGFLLAEAVDESVAAVVLAFAPGGVVEMSLVAVSLEVGVIYVVAHHVARILLAVTVSAIGYRWLFGGPD